MPAPLWCPFCGGVDFSTLRDDGTKVCLGCDSIVYPPVTEVADEGA